jgi:hypothetical protein
MTAMDRSTPDPAAVPEELPGVGIRVGGALVAWFAEAGAAEEWAREHHFGRWLAHPCSMPNRPPFTAEQIAAAEREGEALFQHLVMGRRAD